MTYQCVKGLPLVIIRPSIKAKMKMPAGIVLPSMWSTWNSCTLLVQLQNGSAPLENNLAFSFFFFF